MRKKFFRTRYFTGSSIQVKYLTLLVVSMVVPLVLAGFCLYYLIFTLMAEQIGIPEYIAYTLFPVVKKVNTMLIVGVPPLFLLLLVWGIVFSHRFAGPIERLENELKTVLKDKKYHHRIVLRKNDDIKPVADAINGLLEKLEERHK